MNGNKNISDHHKGVINNDVSINGENMAQGYHDEEKSRLYI